MELLRDRREEFDALGVQPVGISRDSPWTHIAWTQALDLNFGLLSDFNGDAVRAFGDVAWSPGGSTLLVNWLTANQWVFVTGTRAHAVGNIQAQFPGGTMFAGNWCCPNG